MRSEGYLKAERPLARHAEQVARRAPGPEQLLAEFAAAGTRIERLLPDGLAALLGGEACAVACSGAECVDAPQLHKLVDPVAVNWLLGDDAGAQLLVSLNLSGALALTDLVFGGPGLAPPKVPDRLPRSADLALDRVARTLGQALGLAFERQEPLQVALRSDVLGRIVRARDEDMFLIQRCTLTPGSATPCELLLALRQSQAPRLLAAGGAAAQPNDPAGERLLLDGPCGGVPLPLVAVLARLTLPVARISALRPGDSIALPLPREIPLLLQDVEIARGQAGSADGLLALRITQSGLNRKDKTNG